jgi:hypothetical protein
VNQFRISETVVVNTGGEDARGVVMRLDAKLGALIAFENGTKQWIPVQYVRPVQQ